MAIALDPFAFAVVRLHVYAGEFELETGTAFFIRGVRDGVSGHALVTNWHVLSGRNPLAPGMIRHPSGGLPDNIRFTLHHATEDPLDVRLEEVRLDLYSNTDEALWCEHRNAGHRLDVGVIDLRDQLLGKFHVLGVNQLAEANDMAVQLGAEGFVIGYPHGFSPFANTPIWKRASIASDPHLGLEGDNDRVVIDSTTRPGMSGSPVVLRAATHYVSEGGALILAPGATRWIGVYASRPTFSTTEGGQEREVQAEIGYFVKSGAVAATLADHKPASSKHSLPE